MNLEIAFAACAETVKRVDPDRYISALFAPAEKRPILFALYAFNHELAHIGETVKDPMVAGLRREWWREAVESAQASHAHPHGVVQALSAVFENARVPIGLFDEMIAARSADAELLPFSSMEELEAYADRSSGNLMRLAAHILGRAADDSAILRHAGIAYGLTGILRAEASHVVRGKSFMPGALVSEKGKFSAACAIIACASGHHAAARRLPKPGPALTAILPASLVPLYAKYLLASGEDFDRKRTDVPLFRRQWAMLSAAIRGRV